MVIVYFFYLKSKYDFFKILDLLIILFILINNIILTKNKMNKKSLPNDDIWKKVKDLFWFKIDKDISRISIKDLKRYLYDWITEDELNIYRDALAYAVWVVAVREDIKERVIVSVDWRDAAWKWSNISRVTKDLDIKKYWVKAFDIPTAKERFEDNWFKRYMAFFPEKWKIRFFDRSWYNRAWVEPAMWFCTEEEYKYFMENVIPFELKEIYEKEIKHLKIYLSVTKQTQKERLKKRERKIRKNWKSSFVDKAAQEKWKEYTLAKYLTLLGTDHKNSSWMVIDSNEKFLSSIEIMKAIIATNDRLLEIVQNDLDLDLSPNPDIVRSAEKELKLMRKNEDVGKAAKKKWLTIEELENPKNLWKIFNFDKTR